MPRGSADADGWVRQFCTWECAAAFSNSGGQLNVEGRHALLEEAAGRRVHPAPWYSLLQAHGGPLTHTEFIESARQTLSPADRDVAAHEGVELPDSVSAAGRPMRTDAHPVHSEMDAGQSAR